MNQPSEPGARAQQTYRPAWSLTWWRGNRNYQVYMLRELSSLFVALWAWRFVGQLRRLRRGEDAYARYIAAQRRPLPLLFNLVAFAFALLHAVTWFQLSGVVLSGIARQLPLPGRRLTQQDITAGNLASWAAASAGIALALLIGGRDDTK